jgi:hypothetical protein
MRIGSFKAQKKDFDSKNMRRRWGEKYLSPQSNLRRCEGVSLSLSPRFPALTAGASCLLTVLRLSLIV